MENFRPVNGKRDTFEGEPAQIIYFRLVFYDKLKWPQNAYLYSWL